MAPPARLQQQVLEILWCEGPLTVRQVVDRVRPSRAYTTVATVLARLQDRGRILRSEVDGQVLYEANETWCEGVGRRMAAMLDQAAGDPDPLLAAFLDVATATDPDLLDRLQALIEARRERER